MNIEQIIKNNTLYVCPNSIKNQILNYMDKNSIIKNIKFITKEELKKKIYFDYNYKTILHLMNNYNLTMDNANIYINNMYYIDSNDYNSNKIKDLILMKNDLINNNLLIKDKLFIQILKKYNITFIGYDYLIKEDYLLINEIKKYTNIDIIENNEVYDKELSVHEFINIDDEIRYVLYKIIDLINNNISIDKIKLIINNEYEREIIRIFKMYNIKINIDSNNNLYYTKDGKELLKYIDQNISFKDILEKLKDSDYYSNFITIFNKYIPNSDNSKEIYKFIEKDLKNTKIDTIKYKNIIDITELKNNIFDDNDYVFLLGFNTNMYPKIFKDEDFFSDQLKDKLGLSNSKEINQLERESLYKKLLSIPNLTISYKLKTAFEEFYPSIFINDYNMKVIKENEISEYRYSKLDDELLLCSMIDKYIKYGEKNIYLDSFYNSLKIDYLKYDNSYKQIDEDKLRNYLDNKLVLSYSTIDNFYHCKFRYLLSSILKINKYEETFQIKLGNLFHYVLSKIRDDDFDFDKIYEEESKKYINNKKEEFYFKKLKNELFYVLEFIKKEDSITGLIDELFENKFFVKVPSDFDVTFMGVIDKILFRDKNKLLSIIDYKTGNTGIDIKYLPFGLKMQLPSYMYLVRNSDKFKDYKIGGIYLQKIINSANGEDIEESKLESLKLNGYTNSDISKLEIWDSTYENSELIKSLKQKADGNFYSYSKVIDDDQIEKIITMTENNIKNATKEILNADFEINPKKIDGINVGCEFCNYKDICYKKEKDIVNLVGNKDLSFLN